MVCPDLRLFRRVIWVNNENISLNFVHLFFVGKISQFFTKIHTFFCSVDNLSAENSPLHDIVLQSAPGSPGSYPNVHTERVTHADGKLKKVFI